MMAADTTTPLLAGGLSKKERRTKVCHIATGFFAFAMCVGVLSQVRRPDQGSVSTKRKRHDDKVVVVDEAPTSGKVVWPPPDVVHDTWRSLEEDKKKDTIRLEEHYVFSTGLDDLGNSAHIFLKQAYTYWRYGLNGPRAMRRMKAGVEVDSYRYNEKKAFLNALKERRLSAGAFVFVSVTSMALECDLRDFDTLTEDPYSLDPGQIVKDGILRSNRVELLLQSMQLSEPAVKLESLCVYMHTPDLLLRSEMLRELFSYPKPLVLVLAGDSACRLKNFPRTHHAVVFPNDGAQVDPSSPGSDVMWFPEGLEGLEAGADRMFWRPKAEANAVAVTDAPFVPVEQRPFLFNSGMSVNGRKPSRVALIQYLEAGGTEELALVAGEAGLRMRINASAIDMPLEDGGYSSEYLRLQFSGGTVFQHEEEEEGEGAALFALAPAGDTWSSGRTLESLLDGSVPIVDATYLSDDGASAKGCGDAAAFWRDGVPGQLRGAPFVFVDRWERLPDLLRSYGATNRTLMKARLDDLQKYRDELETYLRGGMIGFAVARQHDFGGKKTRKSTCRTTPLTKQQVRNQIQAENDYYESDWYDSFVDRPTYPTGACTTTFHTHGDHIEGPPIIPRYGAPCFDPVCVPSTVQAFECVMN